MQQMNCNIKELLGLIDAGAPVLTVNTRLSRYLRARFDSEMQLNGDAAWPTPVVMPLFSWIESLWNESWPDRPLLSGTRSQALWERVVSSDRFLSKEIIMNSGVAKTAYDAYAMAAMTAMKHTENLKSQGKLKKPIAVALENLFPESYGAHPDAGQRQKGKLSRRRRDYKGSYGIGISRVPRKILSHAGTRFNWAGAVAPGTVGGRRAHPPKAERVWKKKLNIKERRKAIRSALAATIDKRYVEARNHAIPKEYPFIVSASLEDIGRTKDAKQALSALGFTDELARAEVKKVRAGKGKSRGRKYAKRVGPLLVVSGSCKLQKGAQNIPGIRIVEVKKLNASLLAPGCDPGRATIFTDAALDVMTKEKLFM